MTRQVEGFKNLLADHKGIERKVLRSFGIVAVEPFVLFDWVDEVAVLGVDRSISCLEVQFEIEHTARVQEVAEDGSLKRYVLLQGSEGVFTVYAIVAIENLLTYKDSSVRGNGAPEVPNSSSLVIVEEL